LLPVFEARDTVLIVRTWTLGAYPIGDLMWNRRTYDAVFGDVASRYLIVSLKYGDTDFFRYLDVNPLFFHGPQQKIVEFQCRREYEGMGEYPSFVGWLHARYLTALRERSCNLVGMFAIQAGGWAPFRRLAFCGDGSIWNELNTYATVDASPRHVGSPAKLILVANSRWWVGTATDRGDRRCGGRRIRGAAPSRRSLPGSFLNSPPVSMLLKAGMRPWASVG
jgi:hypothetical protein